MRILSTVALFSLFALAGCSTTAPGPDVDMTTTDDVEVQPTTPAEAVKDQKDKPAE